MYAAHPLPRVRALESTKRPLMPKSHNFTLPSASNRIFDGLTSLNDKKKKEDIFTSYFSKSVKGLKKMIVGIDWVSDKYLGFCHKAPRCITPWFCFR